MAGENQLVSLQFGDAGWPGFCKPQGRGALGGPPHPQCGAGWEPALPVPPAGARSVPGGCSAVPRLPGASLPWEDVPSLASTLHSLGIAQVMRFIAEKWKIFSTQLPEGLAHVFPPSFHAVPAGCAP